MILQRFKSKTYWLALLVTILPVLQSNWSLLQQYFGEYQNLVYVVIGVFIAILREVTTKPLSEK